jgi:hypothetical protein
VGKHEAFRADVIYHETKSANWTARTALLPVAPRFVILFTGAQLAN